MAWNLRLRKTSLLKRNELLNHSIASPECLFLECRFQNPCEERPSMMTISRDADHQCLIWFWHHAAVPPKEVRQTGHSFVKHPLIQTEFHFRQTIPHVDKINWQIPQPIRNCNGNGVSTIAIRTLCSGSAHVWNTFRFPAASALNFSVGTSVSPPGPAATGHPSEPARAHPRRSRLGLAAGKRAKHHWGH